MTDEPMIEQPKPVDPTRPPLDVVDQRIRAVDTRKVISLEVDIDPGSPLWMTVELVAREKRTMVFDHEGTTYQMIVRGMMMKPNDERAEILDQQIDKGECLQGITGLVQFEGRELLDGE